MIDSSIAKLTEIYIHQVGTDENPQDLMLSQEPVFVYDDKMKSQLLSYFKNIYNEYEWFAFLNHDSEAPNPMYNESKTLFSNQSHLHFQAGQNIANLLASHSVHPNIKSGQLIIARIEELIVHDEIVTAIAIVKSEQKQSFLKTSVQNGKARLEIDEGIYTKKIDKACLIIETQESDGYRMCIKDNVAKSDSAIYWKTDFLNAGLKMDDYQYTEAYVQATDKFLNEYSSTTGDLNLETEMKIKNKSAEYFNSVEEFDLEDYKQAVFESAEMQEEFETYKNNVNQYQSERIPESFNVSEKAIKRNAKYFRSVIKLDKNFHLYVHGKSEMIERGVDPDGRKFYKLFYEEEH